MAIPAIPAYPLPSESELPANTAPWAVEADRAVLLIHDMQRYFVAPFAEPLAGTLTQNVGALRDAFEAAGAPVTYTAQPGDMTPGQRGLLKDFWGRGMSADAGDRAVLDAISPRPHDVVHTKWRPSAFFRTTLLEQLRLAGRDQLVICGVYAHVGILMSAHEAFSNDIETFVVADAVADFSAEHHWMALEYASARCAVTTSTRAVIEMLKGER